MKTRPLARARGPAKKNLLEDDLDEPLTQPRRQPADVLISATVHHSPCSEGPEKTPPVPATAAQERPVLGQLSANIPGAIPEYLPSLVSEKFVSFVSVLFSICLLCISRDNWETDWNTVSKTRGTLFGKLEEHNLTVCVSLAGWHVHCFWFECGGLRGCVHH